MDSALYSELSLTQFLDPTAAINTPVSLHINISDQTAGASGLEIGEEGLAYFESGPREDFCDDFISACDVLETDESVISNHLQDMYVNDYIIKLSHEDGIDEISDEDRAVWTEHFDISDNCSDDINTMIDETLLLFPFICGLCFERFDNILHYYSHLTKAHEDTDKYFHNHASSEIDEMIYGGHCEFYHCGCCSFISPSLCQLHEHLVEVENIPVYKIFTSSKTAYPCDEEEDFIYIHTNTAEIDASVFAEEILAAETDDVSVNDEVKGEAEMTKQRNVNCRNDVENARNIKFDTFVENSNNLKGNSLESCTSAKWENKTRRRKTYKKKKKKIKLKKKKSKTCKKEIEKSEWLFQQIRMEINDLDDDSDRERYEALAVLQEPETVLEHDQEETNDVLENTVFIAETNEKRSNDNIDDSETTGLNRKLKKEIDDSDRERCEGLTVLKEPETILEHVQEETKVVLENTVFVAETNEKRSNDNIDDSETTGLNKKLKKKIDDSDRERCEALAVLKETETILEHDQEETKVVLENTVLKAKTNEKRSYDNIDDSETTGLNRKLKKKIKGHRLMTDSHGNPVYANKTFIPCEKCGQKVQRCRITKHMSSHKDTREFPCDDCGFEFKTSLQLKQHKRIVHIGGNNSVCQMCGKSFKNNAYLKQHEQTHSDRDKTCPHCPQAFRTAKLLSRHLLVHKDEKQHKCDVCGKEFTYKGSLTSHMHQVHNDVRAYKCDMCGKTFKLRHGLKKHLKIHEPPQFCCSECGKTFVSSFNLKVHMKVHSNMEEVPSG